MSGRIRCEMGKKFDIRDRVVSIFCGSITIWMLGMWFTTGFGAFLWMSALYLLLTIWGWVVMDV